MAIRHLAGRPLVLDDLEHVACERNLAPAGDKRRCARTGTLDLVPLLVEHRPDTSRYRATHDRVTLLQGSALDDHRCDGAAPDLQLRFDDGPNRGSVRVCHKFLDLGNLSLIHISEPTRPY